MSRLTKFSRLVPGKYQRLRQIDTVQPFEFDLIEPPDRQRMLTTVVDSVAALAAAGALDDDTGDALDSTIDAWLAEGVARADYLLLIKQHALETIIAASCQEVSLRRSRAEDAAKRAKAAEDAHQYARQRYFESPDHAAVASGSSAQ